MVSPLLATTKDSLAMAEACLGYSMDQSAMIKWLETLAVPVGGQTAKGEPVTTTGPA